jgi:hypothetical protein
MVNNPHCGRPVLARKLVQAGSKATGEGMDRLATRAITVARQTAANVREVFEIPRGMTRRRATHRHSNFLGFLCSQDQIQSATSKTVLRLSRRAAGGFDKDQSQLRSFYDVTCQRPLCEPISSREIDPKSFNGMGQRHSHFEQYAKQNSHYPDLLVAFRWFFQALRSSSRPVSHVPSVLCRFCQSASVRGSHFPLVLISITLLIECAVLALS